MFVFPFPEQPLFNEMYARDTSRKITSALRAKMKEGQYIGNFAPYGYAKDPNDKNHLIPDDHAAAIVRQIFCWAAAGERPAVIARRLNECGEPSPAVYRCNIYTALDIDRYSKHKAWTSVGISRILCDKVYLGCVVQGKTHKPSLKIRKTKELPEEEWIVVPDRHEPLISWETFETVQHQRAARRCDRKGAFENLFSGLAFCADCGKAMSTVGTRRKGSVANLACGAYKLHGKSACTNHFIAYEELYDCVLGAVRQYVCLTERECDEIFDRLNRRLQLDMRSKETHRERERLTRELENTRRIMNQLYHDHAAGRLNDDTFYQLLETNNTHAAQQEAALRALPNEEKDAGLQALQARLRNLIRRYANIEELNTTLLFELIERIEVGQGKTVKTEQGKQKQQTVKIFFRFLPEPHIAEWIT